MKIIKQSNSDVNLEGATFTLKDVQNQSTRNIHLMQRYCFNNNINYGTYTLKEIKAPNGYALLNADITITVDQNGVQYLEVKKLLLVRKKTVLIQSL